ncbi:MAG: 3-methylornithine--L-lysine ligase PylC [Coriobacteriales bacterium]|jgi:pyrrolysine biosynthesis protein PylC|nr:3-methylornithine--L-lysine ligase PylC [Coriobacteriales bacterium]
MGAQMKRLAALIIGGRLQGIELAYLAHEAGWATTLVDRHPRVPASGLVDRFICADAQDAAVLLPLVAAADLVLPAVEDRGVLEQLVSYGLQTGTDVVCDLDAYRLSASKLRSNALFSALGLPLPEPWPGCGLPVIIKPDALSGSQGVRVARTRDELRVALESVEGTPVIQQYLEGRSWSMELVGNGECFDRLPITEVVCGADFDCECIVAPAGLSLDERAQFIRIADTLGDALHIDGIFDIEVISSEGQLKLLEIDARFPSQTPISVYHATGINMLELLYRRHTKDGLYVEQDRAQCCLYQQIEVEAGVLHFVGEHVLADSEPLRCRKGFFGAEVALTDWQPGSSHWYAILVITAANQAEAEQRSLECVSAIRDSQTAGTASAVSRKRGEPDDTPR